MLNVFQARSFEDCCFCFCAVFFCDQHAAMWNISTTTNNKRMLLRELLRHCAVFHSTQANMPTALSRHWEGHLRKKKKSWMPNNIHTTNPQWERGTQSETELKAAQRRGKNRKVIFFGCRNSQSSAVLMPNPWTACSLYPPASGHTLHRPTSCAHWRPAMSGGASY